MFDVETDPAPAPPRPRTVTVLSLLAGVALIFSYIGAYAITDALVSAEVMRPWGPDADPRPTWMMVGFAVLLVVFVCVGAAARFISRQHLRRIDAMAEEEGSA